MKADQITHKAKVGIFGGAGYTGGELLRLLVHHPACEVSYVVSASQRGKPVSEVHRDLWGSSELCFVEDPDQKVDVVFLCVPHGAAKSVLAANSFAPDVLVVDLSQDHRWSEGFAYGLPEAYRSQIRACRRIANPGCFATAIQLALLPLLQAQLISCDVHIAAITGSTGAGVKASATTHFSWRDSNVSVYKAFAHQHQLEIQRTMRDLQPQFGAQLCWVPMRGNFTRGILASVHLQLEPSIDCTQLYREFYQAEPFVEILPHEVSIKQVVNTNRCFLSVERVGNYVHVVGVIDNLLKGAAGQAVQNMNLCQGWPEDLGLNLKPSVF